MDQNRGMFPPAAQKNSSRISPKEQLFEVPTMRMAATNQWHNRQLNSMAEQGKLLIKISAPLW